jgi:hypothetical protein
MLMRQRFGPMGKPAGCRICGTRLSFHEQVSGQLCSDWQCKTTLLEQEMAAHRKQASAVLGVRRSDSYPMVVVPDDPAGINRLPESRKQVHWAFIYDLCVKTIDSGNDADNASPDADPAGMDPPATIALHVCAVCRGACCHLGKDHAFLDEAAICRFKGHSGITNPLDIVHAYAVNLPPMAVVNGCVYQSEQGCTLPRWMRADICNAYRCKGLKQAERMIRCHDDSRLYVVVRKDNRISRAAFVQADRIRHSPANDHPSMKTMSVFH